MPKNGCGGRGASHQVIHFLSKYLLSACCVLGIILGSRFSGNFFFFEFVSVFQIFSHDPVSLLPSNESLYHQKMNVHSIRTMSTTGTDVLRAVWQHVPAIYCCVTNHNTRGRKTTTRGHCYFVSWFWGSWGSARRFFLGASHAHAVAVRW